MLAYFSVICQIFAFPLHENIILIPNPHLCLPSQKPFRLCEIPSRLGYGSWLDLLSSSSSSGE